MEIKLRLLWAGALLAACPLAFAQTSSLSKPAPLLRQADIASSALVALKGTVPLRTASSIDAGVVPTTQVIPSMTLLLKRSAAQQQAFDAYLTALNNPASPYFHHWLTAAQVGEQFGPDLQDVETVKQWLTSQGLQVKSVSPTRMMIRFAGSAGAVQRAFHTQMRHYLANGRTHYANASEQQLPAALTPVVAGAASLTNFFPEPLVRNVQAVKRDGKGGWKPLDGRSADFNFAYDGSIYYDVVPADLNKIYNVEPLWQGATPIRGAGQSIAVLERTNVLDADVATFRHTFLPANARGVFSQIHPLVSAGDTSCVDPGTNGDEGEAALDAQWAGAAAPDADVVLASCADQGSDFGPFIAAQNLLLQPAPPPIMSLSYGECELISAAVGDADEASELWSLAAAEGVTVMVSSGDAGSAGCDQNQRAATFGIASNGLGSTPYNVAVGGTDFDDLDKTSQYWMPANGALGVSALGYIPEQPWNSSCASSKLYPLLGFANANAACNSAAGANFLNTAGGSGGPSYLWSQPGWQVGIAGMPQSRDRAIPDVSLFAASGVYGHALIYCMSDPEQGGTPCNYLDPEASIYNSAGGTSFAAPTLAGIQALINQKAGVRHGNVAPQLYDLALKQYGTVASPAAACDANGTDTGCVFHDISVGDIAVPCFTGSADCYSKGNKDYGVISAGGSVSLAAAWKAGSGYDYATGLGSVNVTHLVDALASQDARAGIQPVWSFMGLNESGNDTGSQFTGHSNVLLLKQDGGQAIVLGLNGGSLIVANTSSGLNFAAGDRVQAVVTDVGTLGLVGQPVLEADNPDTHLATAAAYAQGWVTVGLGDAGANWELLGSGTLNDAGVSQELWHNTSNGKLRLWQVNCHALRVLGKLQVQCGHQAGATLAGLAGYQPHLADLNGDGYLDIVWTGGDNQIVYWVNDGKGGFSKTKGGSYPAGWVLEGAGAVADNGHTDLLWFDPAGSQLTWWSMDGAKLVASKSRKVAAGMQLASIEDFDGDGLADLLWTNAEGKAQVWLGKGNGFVVQKLADGSGKAYRIPAGYVVQANRLQGVRAVGAADADRAPAIVAAASVD